jgi:hypothetical protein
MRDDPWLVQTVRVLAVLIGLSVAVLGGLLIERDLLEALYPVWGWLMEAALGGGMMGLGVGLTVFGVNGENATLERLRLRAAREPSPRALESRSQDEGRRPRRASDEGEAQNGD